MSIPPFILHYIDQVADPKCTAALLKLSTEFNEAQTRLSESASVKAGTAYLFNKTFGANLKTNVESELNDLKHEYIQKAKEIANDFAIKEGLKIDEWREPEPQKSVIQKSLETDNSLKDTQEKMLRMLRDFKPPSRDGIDR